MSDLSSVTTAELFQELERRAELRPDMTFIWSVTCHDVDVPGGAANHWGIRGHPIHARGNLLTLLETVTNLCHNPPPRPQKENRYGW